MHVSADPRIDTELAGYRVERLLGRGGMSVVYLAEDSRLGRKVALKLLAPELAEDERFRERFLRESRLAASIDHQNVIPIYEAGETDGVLFIAMRYVEGTDLKRLLAQEGRLDPARALALLDQVAAALDEAHAHGLVHRDVKPSNILVAAQRAGEQVYLADFGLTKQTASETGVTETGQFVGTADYVSPEQISREPAGSSSDQYSLACVLYECLTGQAPYRSESLMGVLFAHVNSPTPSAHQRRPDLPEEIDAVIAKGMAKNPQERFPSCRALLGDAKQALGITGDLPTLTRPRVAGRTLAALALLILALAAAAAAAVMFMTRGGQTPATAPAAEAAAPIIVTTDSVVRVDPATNEPVALAEVGVNPTAVAVGEGAVWVANRDDGTVSRVDPATTRVTRTVSVGGTPLDVATGEGSVWVIGSARGEATLTRIESRSGQVLGKTSLGYTDGRGVAVGHGAVWVTVDDLAKGAALLRIEPSSGRVVETISLPSAGFQIAVDEEAVWVVSLYKRGKPFLARVDPATGAVVEPVALGPVDFPGGVAAGNDAVWITSALSNALVRISTATSGASRAIKVGSNPGDIALDGESVWVANDGDRTLSRVNAETGAVVDTVALGGEGLSLYYVPALSVAAGEGAVWATVAVP